MLVVALELQKRRKRRIRSNKRKRRQRGAKKKPKDLRLRYATCEAWMPERPVAYRPRLLPPGASPRKPAISPTLELAKKAKRAFEKLSSLVGPPYQGQVTRTNRFYVQVPSTQGPHRPETHSQYVTFRDITNVEGDERTREKGDNRVHGTSGTLGRRVNGFTEPQHEGTHGVRGLRRAQSASELSRHRAAIPVLSKEETGGSSVDGIHRDSLVTVPPPAISHWSAPTSQKGSGSGSSDKTPHHFFPGRPRLKTHSRSASKLSDDLSPSVESAQDIFLAHSLKPHVSERSIAKLPRVSSDDDDEYGWQQASATRRESANFVGRQIHESSALEGRILRNTLSESASLSRLDSQSSASFTVSVSGVSQVSYAAPPKHFASSEQLLEVQKRRLKGDANLSSARLMLDSPSKTTTGFMKMFGKFMRGSERSPCLPEDKTRAATDEKVSERTDIDDTTSWETLLRNMTPSERRQLGKEVEEALDFTFALFSDGAADSIPDNEQDASLQSLGVPSPSESVSKSKEEQLNVDSMAYTLLQLREFLVTEAEQDAREHDFSDEESISRVVRNERCFSEAQMAPAVTRRSTSVHSVMQINPAEEARDSILSMKGVVLSPAQAKHHLTEPVMSTFRRTRSRSCSQLGDESDDDFVTEVQFSLSRKAGSFSAPVTSPRSSFDEEAARDLAMLRKSHPQHDTSDIEDAASSEVDSEQISVVSSDDALAHRTKLAAAVLAPEATASKRSRMRQQSGTIGEGLEAIFRVMARSSKKGEKVSVQRAAQFNEYLAGITMSEALADANELFRIVGLPTSEKITRKLWLSAWRSAIKQHGLSIAFKFLKDYAHVTSEARQCSFKQFLANRGSLHTALGGVKREIELRRVFDKIRRGRRRSKELKRPNQPLDFIFVSDAMEFNLYLADTLRNVSDRAVLCERARKDALEFMQSAMQLTNQTQSTPTVPPPASLATLARIKSEKLEENFRVGFSDWLNVWRHAARRGGLDIVDRFVRNCRKAATVASERKKLEKQKLKVMSLSERRRIAEQRFLEQRRAARERIDRQLPTGSKQRQAARVQLPRVSPQTGISDSNHESKRPRPL